MPLTALGAAVGGMFGLANTIFGNDLAAERAAIDRRENYRYNEMAAQNAYARQVGYANQFLTPQAQVNQLKDAGLSVGLMYGGATTAGGSTAPQGGGVSGIQTGHHTMDLSSLMTIAQIKNLQANTNLTNAKANTENGENARGTEEIAKIIAERIGTQAATNYTESQTALNNFELALKDETRSMTVEQMEQAVNKAYEDAKLAMYAALDKQLDVQLKQDTYKDTVEQARLKTEEMGKEILLKDSQIKLNEQQAEYLAKEVSLMFAKWNLEHSKYTLSKEIFEWDKEKFDKEYKRIIDQFNKTYSQNYDIALMRVKFDLLGKVLGGSLAGGVFGMIGKL